MCVCAQMLCLQLRRGHWDAVSGRRVKLQGPVAFPLHLNLAPFTGWADASVGGPQGGHALPVGGGCRAPPASASLMGSVFLRQLDEVTCQVLA